MARKDADKEKAFRKAPKNKGGRPLQLTDELIAKICHEIELGNYKETAFAVAGVPKSTFFLWMKLAHKKPKSMYRKLLDSVTLSEAKSESNDVARMKLHSARNYKATAWRLARRFPDRWADKITKEGDIKTENEFKLAYNFDDDEEETE